MICDPPPRSIDEGLDWFLSHDASGSGMCAQHTWHSLGGDRGCPPAWGCSDANAVYDKVKKSGRYWTSPKRGDIALWKYGSNGHAARVYDDGGTLIATTNPTGESGGGTGIEPIGYPAKWGATTSARIFTDTYNGIKCFDSEDSDVSNTYDYDYLDKPSGTFTVTTEYKTLDQSNWSPPRSGWENSFVYLNIKPTFKEGKTAGAIRVRVYREDGDTTGHHDLIIIKDALDSEGKTLRHWMYWEQGGKGDTTKVQLQCIGGLQSAAIGTRYTKKAVVVD
jgi:hypothetical protein